MTTADEEKNKEQELEEEHKLSKETIEDLDASEEARDVRGGSQGANTRGLDCEDNAYTASI
jgi:hypothetical protein